MSTRRTMMLLATLTALGVDDKLLGEIGAAAKEPEPVLNEGPIHWASYASQPDVQLACDRTWGIPDVMKGDHRLGIYELENGKKYSFDVTNVTCPNCQALESFQLADRMLAWGRRDVE